MKGVIYLIQPAELVGTNRYKIGCSKKPNLDRVKKGYKKGTRYLHIAECEEPHKTESCIKIRFNDKFTLIAGKEYYEGDETNMKQEFINVISNQNEIKEEKSTEQSSTKETTTEQSSTKETTTKQSSTKETTTEQSSTKETTTEESNKKENMNTDDNFTFEDLPMFLQVFLDRTFIDENGIEYYDNRRLFWATIDNINSSQITQYKKTNAIFHNLGDFTVINFTDNFSENEINIITEHNLHNVESIIRNDNLDKNEKKRVIQCYKYVTTRYKINNIEPPNGQTYLTLDNILFIILINHKAEITFTKKLPGKNEDYQIISF
jgi:hypothetical protein